jgi:2-succinyl-6-hydroxy-2,4-cyclohexadiene-1-carboxylate synthase
VSWIHEPFRFILGLHGFTLGGVMFRELNQMVDAPIVAPDLPGHGGRDASATSWDEAVDSVVESARTFQPATVLGYSMGGRLALGAALQHPKLFPRLVLVSTSLGIEDEAERAERLSSDVAHAAAIERAGSAENFVRSFGSMPFLQAPGSSLDLDSIRLANRADGIAGALRGMGQGSQPYLGGELGHLEMPVVWIAGSRDEKYTAVARQAAAATPAGSVVVVDAGHNVIAEQPGAVAAVLMGR